MVDAGDLAFCDALNKRDSDDTTNPQQMTLLWSQKRGDSEGKKHYRMGLLSCSPTTSLEPLKTLCYILFILFYFIWISLVCIYI